ncbi:hypothetical protein PPL_12086 [Heterostelium album PN500]|uniref:Uncharacterized protein n=1 Tax=Heterostelium pallidum (strain ATCC 26659 / Pp 5 / PN500) TaxID=670386 RepID=D3BLN3_HETP5|nr:hypothetical protein PPL_12086 [Heterostelium album PN500]EFA77484.1 hypothetical protein PPL_12086 [Heterostelium album PN500]|eukprot:XP_020429612.1 hypothetical protein PPL_12086 [Heterostelium album PN500]
MIKLQSATPLPSIMITPESPQIGSLTINSSPIFSPFYISEFLSKEVFYPPPLDISGDMTMDEDDATVPQSPNSSLTSNSIVSSTASSKLKSNDMMLRNKNACSSCNRVIQLYLVSSRSRRKCGTQCISCHRMICDNCTFLKYYKHQSKDISSTSSSSSNVTEKNNTNYLPIKRSPSPKSTAQSKRVTYCISCSQHQKKTPFNI